MHYKSKSKESTRFENWYYANLCSDPNSVVVTQSLSHLGKQSESDGAGFCINKMLHDTTSLLDKVLFPYESPYYYIVW